MEKIRIYLIRHGRQESALCNVDVKLCKAGIKQAELVGERLKTYGIRKIYSSNLIRAVETAQIINKSINVSHKRMEGLKEIDFGELTGLEDSVIKERFSDFLKKRDLYDEDMPFPDGENGKQVYDRAKECIDKIVEEALEDNMDSIAVVSHGGTIRSILAGLLGMPMEKRLLFSKTMENTAITQIDYNTKMNRYYVERINDYAHLEGHDDLLRKYFK